MRIDGDAAADAKRAALERAAAVVREIDAGEMREQLSRHSDVDVDHMDLAVAEGDPLDVAVETRLQAEAVDSASLAETYNALASARDAADEYLRYVVRLNSEPDALEATRLKSEWALDETDGFMPGAGLRWQIALSWAAFFLFGGAVGFALARIA